MSVVITRNQRRGIVGAAVALVVLAVVAINALGRGEITSAEGDLPAADLALFDGDIAAFDEFEGTPLVVNFWASWCPACVAELPEFQTVHEDLGDDVAFLGIANADQRSAAEALAAEVGLTYTLADDPQGELFREFELISMPSTVFVTADGEILEVFGGQLNEQALRDRVDRLQASS